VDKPHLGHISRHRDHRFAKARPRFHEKRDRLRQTQRVPLQHQLIGHDAAKSPVTFPTRLFIEPPHTCVPRVIAIHEILHTVRDTVKTSGLN
jgi:hypothetical protein